jgi:HEAT repeats
MPDPLQPANSGDASLASKAAEGPVPSEGGGVKAPVEAEQMARNASPPSAAAPATAATERSWMDGNGPVVAYFLFLLAAIIGFSLLAAWGIRRGAKELSKISATRGDNGSALSSQTTGSAIDPAAQDEAEKLLARVGAGDAAAAEQVLAESDDWTGKTRRTARTDQAVSTALNLGSARAREATVQAALALDGVPRNQRGVARMEQAVGDPSQRAWAFWMLGALGNRGVDPIHTVKIIESYLSDPDVNVRADAVDALSLVATDETIPMLLDRFRNDPSPVVQERAACDVAHAGMYTHAQRMAAAASLVGWVDDSLLSAQQRAWTVQALGDISGKNFGVNSAAWKNWYDGAR